ncbi:7189_t:CDS:2 [Acaulospora colombiana]|uniref:7189_t:CDS:1 n=1 Tax=Acaulospora colombiana TaxID=27376 RepID=A0ACA9M4S1_9GLOM|nr:7189_t:CDS:2 [Acaulospora colombiana]
MTELKVESAGQLESEIKKIQETFQQKETEHTWQLFDDAIKRLIALCRGGAVNYEKSFLNGVKSLRQPIVDSMLTERTRLSGTATEFVEELARILGSKFESLSEMYVPAILKLCTRANKIFVSRAQKCMISIIRCCQLPSLLPKLKESMQGQSKTLRTCVAEFVLTIIEVNDVGNLNNYISDLEWLIREGAIDSTPAVRSTMKKTFEIYKTKFDLRLGDFIATLPSQVKKNLNVQEQLTTISQRPRIRALQQNRKENAQPPQDDVVIYMKDEEKSSNKGVFIPEKKAVKKEENEFTIDFRLPASKNKSENSVAAEKENPNPSIMPVVPFMGTTTTVTGFAATKRPKLSSAQRFKSQPAITSTAQRVPSKPVKAQSTSSLTTLNRDNPTGNGNEEKTKASRVLNTNKTNTKSARPPPPRTISAPTVSPSKSDKKVQPPVNIKKKSAPVTYGRPAAKESRSIMNSTPKPTKVTATATTTADGLTTTATISVSISAVSTPVNRAQVTPDKNAVTSSARLFGRTKDRQFTPYQKPAIGFATRKFKARSIPDSLELNSKINAYANKLIEELTGQREIISENINDEVISVELTKIEEQIFETNPVRSRLSLKQALPATQVITPLPVDPAPPLSFVDPVKFLEDVREAAETNKENEMIGENDDKVIVSDAVTKSAICELVERTNEVKIEGE